MSIAAQRLRENETGHRYQPSQPATETQVLPKKGITKGEKVLWILGILTVFVLCITIVSKEAALYNQSKQISELQTKIDQTSSVNTGLSTQIAQLNAPQRIIQYAETKLGMSLNVKNVKVVK